MTDVQRIPDAGFSLDKIYFVEQVQRLIEQNEASTDRPDGLHVQFGWDWRIVGPNSFEIAIQLGVAPTQSRPEQLSTKVCGSFTVRGPMPAVAIVDFVRIQGPAILFPYVREAIASLAARGPFGAIYLPPMNVLKLMEHVDPAAATGAKQMRSGEQLVLAQ